MRKLIVVAIAGILIWIFWNNRQKVDLNKPIGITEAAPDAADATPVAAPGEATPGVTPPATPAAPPAPTPNAALQARLARMRQYAPETGVELIGLRPEQGGGWIEVAWSSGDTTLGVDYIKKLMDEGVVRDFDVNRTNIGASMRDGRRWWVGRYFVYF